MKSTTYDQPTDSARSDLMRRVRQKGTAAELQVAEVLRELGLHYRKNVRTLPGTPDFANRSRKWALFVNGCFWHHHGGCPRATVPSRNRSFWLAKFEANRIRDAGKILRLRRQGFRVLIVWECELRKSGLRNRIERFAGRS
jgi:DNA mismatch endonuclease, patch repair protein